MSREYAIPGGFVSDQLGRDFMLPGAFLAGEPVVGAPPAFRASTVSGYASRTFTPVAAPAGLADRDIMLAGIFSGAGSAPAGIGALAGWTEVMTPVDLGAGSFFGRFQLFWKRALFETVAFYDFPHVGGATYTTQGGILAYSGCIETGSPIDAVSTNFANSGSVSTALGVTTTVANAMLAWFGNDWTASGALTPPSGFSERIDSLLYGADAVQAAAGASGNKAMNNGNPPTGNSWSACLVALKPIPSEAPPVVGGSGYAKVYAGGAWAMKPVKVWNGSSWVVKPAKVWTGVAWKVTT